MLAKRIPNWFWLPFFLTSSFAFSESGLTSNLYIQQFIDFTQNQNIFGKTFTPPGSTPTLPDPKGPHSSVTGVYDSNPLSSSHLALPASPWVIQKSGTTSRTSLSPNALKPIQDTAVDAIKTSDPDFKITPVDAREMGNLTLYREAANRATKSLWDHTLARLTQRKVFLATKLELSDSNPTCEEAAKAPAASVLPDLAMRTVTCNLLLGESWKTVKDIASEDPEVRDLRNQLQAMDTVGIAREDFQSNWNYQDSEFRTQHSDSLNNAEQLIEYNKALDRGAASFQELHRTTPDVSFDPFSIGIHQITPASVHAVEVNRPTENLYREFGVTPVPNEKPSSTYKELLDEHRN